MEFRPEVWGKFIKVSFAILLAIASSKGVFQSLNDPSHVQADERTTCRQIADFDGVRVNEIHWTRDGQYIVANINWRFPELRFIPVSANMPAYESNPLALPLMWSPVLQSIAWNHAGTMVAYRDDEHEKIIVRDAENNLITEIPASWAFGIAWSADGKYLAVGQIEPEETLEIWDTERWVLHWLFEDVRDLRNSTFAWHPEESWFIIPIDSIYDTKLRIFDATTTLVSQSLELPWDNSGDNQSPILFFSPLWSTSGKYVVTDFDMMPFDAVAWEVDSGEYIDTNLPPLSDWDFHGDLLAIAFTDNDNPLAIWDVATQTFVVEYRLDQERQFSHVRWNPQGTYVAGSLPNEVYLCPVPDIDTP